jgi:hypothetical protein
MTTELTRIPHRLNWPKNSEKSDHNQNEISSFPLSEKLVYFSDISKELSIIFYKPSGPIYDGPWTAEERLTSFKEPNHDDRSISR